MKYFLLITFTIILLGCNNNTSKNHTPQDEPIPTEGRIINNEESVIHNQDTENPQNHPSNITIDENETIINNGEGVINNQDTENPQSHPNNTTIDENETIKADIVEISVSNTADNYNFFVTIKSNETGCDQYADWWEILDTEGKLLYRRILMHSHPDEQPFKRSGGSINIQKDERVYIRAHMNNKGYSGNTFIGTIDDGFTLLQESTTFDKEIEEQAPLPGNCAF